jgi:alkanesulfonate monooxygenase SsuD/methylene tetrahydromethanopterin reductase-like flavin-dependent oxidoreductase (luciferase family)
VERPNPARHRPGKHRARLADRSPGPASPPADPARRLHAAGLDRIARSADGWLPTSLPFDAIAAGWTTVRDGAAAAGRDPHALELIVRAAPTFSDAALRPTRAPFTGSWRQIADDVAHTRDLGAHELIIDLQAQVTRPDELVDTALELAAGAITTIVA